MPEFQIHLGCWIMRETAQHYLPLLWLRKIAQQLASNSLAPQPNRQHWRYPADNLQEIPYKTLRSSQAFFAREAGGYEIHSAYTLGSLLYPLYRSLRPEQCLEDVERRPSFLKQGAKGAYQDRALREDQLEDRAADSQLRWQSLIRSNGTASLLLE